MYDRFDYWLTDDALMLCSADSSVRALYTLDTGSIHWDPLYAGSLHWIYTLEFSRHWTYTLGSFIPWIFTLDLCTGIL